VVHIVTPNPFPLQTPSLPQAKEFVAVGAERNGDCARACT
jgi:hypothetical protein